MKTLLIADDSQAKIDLILAMLRHFHWIGDALVAMTTEEAMKLIDEHKITHALIDFYIPSEHGPAIMRYLKKNNPNARIALVSSSDKPENIDEAKAAGAESCICTSWQSDEVERAFGDVLRGWLEASS